MSKGVGFRPKLLPPHGRSLERSRRPYITCFTVTGAIAVLVFVVFGLTAYNIYSNRFSGTEHDYHVGDMVSMQWASEDLSSTFCQAYEVHTLNKTNFYLLPSRAQIDPSYRRSAQFNINMRPGHWPLYVYRVRQLLQESTVSMQACRHLESGTEEADHPTEFAVIRGKSNFEEWRKHFNSRHILYHVDIPKDASCVNSSSTLPNLNFTVDQSDIFHFLLIQHHHMPSPHFVMPGDITLSVKLSMTRYDLDGALEVCNNTEPSCEFPLPWGSSRDVVAWVVDRGENVIHQDIDATFQTDCIERLAFWLPVFVAVPIVMVVLVSIGCFYILIVNRSIESRYRHPLSSQSSTVTSYGAAGQEDSPLLGSGIAEGPPEDDDGQASIQDE